MCQSCQVSHESGAAARQNLRPRAGTRFISHSMGNARSMTGYGRSTFSVGKLDFAVEISSVNQRGLAVSVSTIPEWAIAAERLFAPLAKKYVSRGKVIIAIRPDIAARAGSAAESFSWDEEAARASALRLKAATEKLGISFVPDAKFYLRLAEIHRKKSAEIPSLEDADVVATVSAAVISALKKLDEMREREGEFLRCDLMLRIEKIRALVGKIRELSADTVKNFRAALLARLKGMDLKIDFDDERFLREIAFFADRCDIEEELTRLDSHLGQFADCLGERESGRKLDFVCQEILRELNTIGSKANNVAVTRCVVEAKNEQERLREQVQNIE